MAEAVAPLRLLWCPGEDDNVLARRLGAVGSARIEDAGLLLAVWQPLAPPHRLCFHARVAVFDGRHCYFRHHPCRWLLAVLEQALARWDRFCHATLPKSLQIVVFLVAVEIAAVPILLAWDLPCLDDCIAVVWTQEHVHVQILQLEVVGWEEALRPADGVSPFAMVLERVHGIVTGPEDAILRGVGGGVVSEDALPVPENLEAFESRLWPHVGDDQTVAPQHATSQSDAHSRARCWEAVRVTETTMNAQVLGFHKVVLTWISHRDGRAVDAIPRDHVGVAKDGALAPGPLANQLGEVAAPRLALAGADVTLAEAHALPGHAFCPVGEKNTLAMLRATADIAALLQRDIVERGALARTDGTGEWHGRSSETVQVTSHDFRVWHTPRCRRRTCRRATMVLVLATPGLPFCGPRMYSSVTFHTLEEDAAVESRGRTRSCGSCSCCRTCGRDGCCRCACRSRGAACVRMGAAPFPLGGRPSSSLVAKCMHPAVVRQGGCRAGSGGGGEGLRCCATAPHMLTAPAPLGIGPPPLQTVIARGVVCKAVVGQSCACGCSAGDTTTLLVLAAPLPFGHRPDTVFQALAVVG
mmetsp:Transcript_62411/g.145252  ORF Transcript_62411/g.145252 Transcript_62411/m.145252 type:complete len:583 (-) Transcript_62411:714-2462(-)